MKTQLALGLLAATGLALTACGTHDSGPQVGAGGGDPAVPTASASSTSGASVVVAVADSELGSVLTGPDGRPLYGFTNDLRGRSTCFGTCAEAWPPVLVGPDWTVGPELDNGVFSTVERSDGTTQLVAGRWPLYYYAGDTAPGDLNGQGSGDVWFVVSTDAGLIRDDVDGDGGSTEGPGDDSGSGKPVAGDASSVDGTLAQ